MSKTRQPLKRMEELKHWIIEFSFRGRHRRYGMTTYPNREYALEMAEKYMASEHFRRNFAGWKVTVYELECNQATECGTISALRPDETPQEMTRY